MAGDSPNVKLPVNILNYKHLFYPFLLNLKSEIAPKHFGVLPSTCPQTAYPMFHITPYPFNELQRCSHATQEFSTDYGVLHGGS
jgi:hypothetical protein